MLLDTSKKSPFGVAAVQSQDFAKNRIMCTCVLTVNLYPTMQMQVWWVQLFSCQKKNDWLIYNCVRDLTVPMHPGLNWWALCAPYQYMGALLLC